MNIFARLNALPSPSSLSSQVHLLVDGRLRLVPDADTFVAMGFSWGNIKTLHSVVAEGYAQGPPLPQRRPS